MTPPPNIAPGSAEVSVGTNYKSDPSFYAPVDWKKNGVELPDVNNGIKCGPASDIIDRRSLKVTEGQKGPSYPEYLPVWDTSLHYEPYEPLENVFQPGLQANPAKPNLLTADAKVSNLSPKVGSVVDGVQLSTLTDAGKDELALFVAQRGVVVFRNQDLANLGPQGVVDYGKYFGPLHIHPASGHPQGFPELHLVYRGPEAGYSSFP
jgi:Taurine catabolism dioxygenase TauD, TfdA family